jgi:hypothetical protein
MIKRYLAIRSKAVPQSTVSFTDLDQGREILSRFSLPKSMKHSVLKFELFYFYGLTLNTSGLNVLNLIRNTVHDGKFEYFMLITEFVLAWEFFFVGHFFA